MTTSLRVVGGVVALLVLLVAGLLVGARSRTTWILDRDGKADIPCGWLGDPA